LYLALDLTISKWLTETILSMLEYEIEETGTTRRGVRVLCHKLPIGEGNICRVLP
jgi:hypothetical protein